MPIQLINGPHLETQLSHALTAYRNSVSTVTGYTPYFMHCARRACVALARMLGIQEEIMNPMNDRLADMAEVMANAGYTLNNLDLTTETD